MLQIMSVGEYESFWMGEEKKSVDETAVGNAYKLKKNSWKCEL